MKVVGLGPNQRVGKAHIVLPSLENVTWKDLQQHLANYDTSSWTDKSENL